MSQVSGPNVGLIAGLSVLGVVLLLLGVAALIYFCVLRPRMMAAKKYNGVAEDDQNLTKFDKSSTRINQWWPRSPQRYAPQTYAPQDEAAANF